ncbi:hypothetical protein [uncultured Kordia sp.]|uniref:hypothetical protein n=1 Tax=uncultured Kordia sp. TaxID=507699 RepID=UPI0026129D5A|nr:hypothetical protein [uncultured Kordia sp.]
MQKNNNIKISKLFFFIMIPLQLITAQTVSNTTGINLFKGKYLISVSDADMVASAYTNGKLGAREGTDMMSIIDLKVSLNKASAIEVPASNSVGGPPAVLAVDKSGTYAYIIETFTPRPKTNNKEHMFSDLDLGQILTVYNIKNKKAPKLVGKQKIEKRPVSIDISPDGNWLLISYYTSPENKKHLGVYKVEKGKIVETYFPEIPKWKLTDKLIYASWHPDGKTISLINNAKAEVSFFKIDLEKKVITKWGNTVSVGKFPMIGRFTKEGKHFLVNNTFWGKDVQGTWNSAPKGTIGNISLAVEGEENIRHELSSQVMVGVSPEGFAVSPEGDFVISANMERSWLPYNDSRQGWFSSLSLIKRNPKTGAMRVIHTIPFEGILPESLVFDTTGRNIAVTTFDHYDNNIEGGAIDFFKIISDPLNSEEKMIMQTRNSIPVTRGPHTMILID